MLLAVGFRYPGHVWLPGYLETQDVFTFAIFIPYFITLVVSLMEIDEECSLFHAKKGTYMLCFFLQAARKGRMHEWLL